MSRHLSNGSIIDVICWKRALENANQCILRETTGSLGKQYQQPEQTISTAAMLQPAKPSPFHN